MKTREQLIAEIPVELQDPCYCTAHPCNHDRAMEELPHGLVKVIQQRWLGKVLLRRTDSGGNNV